MNFQTNLYFVFFFLNRVNKTKHKKKKVKSDELRRLKMDEATNFVDYVTTRTVVCC